MEFFRITLLMKVGDPSVVCCPSCHNFLGKFSRHQKSTSYTRKTPALVCYLCNLNVWVIWAVGVWPPVLIFLWGWRTTRRIHSNV